jgi:hypothetical protein
MNLKKKLYVLVRKDLSVSQQAVQAGHAVAEYLLGGFNESQWDNGTLVYLGVKNRGQLERWMSRLRDRDVKFAVFCEPDIGNEPTAIATTEGKELFKKLNLV